MSSAGRSYHVVLNSLAHLGDILALGDPDFREKEFLVVHDALLTRLAEHNAKLEEHNARLENGELFVPIGTLRIDGTVPKASLVDQLKSKNAYVNNVAKAMIKNPSFAMPDKPTSIELVQIRIEDLVQTVFHKDLSLPDVIEEASRFGLEPCPAWVGPALLLTPQGKQTEDDNFSYIAMHPIKITPDDVETFSGYNIHRDHVFMLQGKDYITGDFTDHLLSSENIIFAKPQNPQQ